MVHVAVELVCNGLIHLYEVVILVVFFLGPLGQVLHDTLQVLDTIFRGFHVVVAQVLCLGTWVFITTFTTKPQTRVAFQNIRGLGHEFFLLLVFILELRAPLITPLDSPFVVVVDTRKQTFGRDVVLGLCHIIETGIVHDAGRVAIFLDPCLVAQLLNGCSKRSTHVVTQTQ